MVINVQIPAEADPLRSEMESIAAGIGRIFHTEVQYVPGRFVVEDAGISTIICAVLKYSHPVLPAGEKSTPKVGKTSKVTTTKRFYVYQSGPSFGEKISAQALHRNLRNGTISPNSRFDNPKGEHFVVMRIENNLELIKEPA